MTTPASPWSRPLVRLALVAFASVFMAAPTPGNVGGCTSSHASRDSVVMPGDTTLNPPETAEYMFFDRGLCSHFCWRLRECGLLCAGLGRDEGTCDNDAPETFQDCVRGDIRGDVFGFPRCPHSCPEGTTYVQAYEWDVEACGHAVLARSCGSIQDIFRTTPGECLNVCQVQ